MQRFSEAQFRKGEKKKQFQPHLIAERTMGRKKTKLAELGKIDRGK